MNEDHENFKRASSKDQDTQQAYSGTRTPRKIRWRDEGRLSGSDGATHSLDPEGQDPEAFGSLVEALERHRSTRITPKRTASTPLASKVHYYSNRPETHGRHDEDNLNNHTKHNVGFNSDESSSVDETDKEADQRGTTSGTSGPWRLGRTISPRRISRVVPDPSALAQFSDDEDAGLPKENLKWYSKRRAKQMVDLHASRIWGQRPGGHTSKAHHRRNVHRSLENETHEASFDVEHRLADGENFRPEDEVSGGGILSALLQLYGHDLDSAAPSGYSSGVSSGYSSGVSTPLSEGWQSNSQLELSSREGKQEGRFDDKSRKRPRIPRPHVNIPALGMVRRPSQSRSGGGVFGPLIAATGNLGGVAAPYHSQLQPDVHRSGYKVSRYTTEDVRPPPVAYPAHTRSRSDSAMELQRMSSPHSTSMAHSVPISPTPTLLEHDHKPTRKGLRRLPSIAKSIGSTGRLSGRSTPRGSQSEDSIFGSRDALSKSAPRSEKKERRRKRKKAEIYITRHIAQVIRREEFILKLTRAMMMFGSPSHRLPSQIQSAAHVLDIRLSFLYLPDVALVSFDDASTGTSHIKLIKQGSSLDIDKLIHAFELYWRVIYDKLSATDASKTLDALMVKPPMYNWWKLALIGGMCSASICTVSYGGSFIDALISFPLGALLIVIQLLSVRNVLYVHVFEITITMLYSFIAAALAASQKFCYSAVASSSVVLILPGFIVLQGSLEIMSRNIVSGSVRLCYAIVYALFLGFGFAIGAEIYESMTSTKIFGTEDYECTASHRPDGPWYQRTPPKLWDKFPMFSCFLSLKNQAPWNRRETPVLICIACIGWMTNYFSGLKFAGQSDITAAIGAFTVGLISNVYARIFSGNAFVITGILFQLPSGLGIGGLLSYATEQASGSTTSYISGFKTTGKLVSVAIGLTIGLALSVVVTHPIQSKRREAGIFSL
ncbi:DUF1212-domain-containing protein [Coprinopsis marcescibilis]|uniref:DUF1212-domain-containing protein n=1 Tax=Coprinopsis marcescibilis TaxID=230819 RepID=A0A5C3KRU2_COPMA|nr:DUF1212-domain-containing protein [Coprinopsis marcescibilis]